jgi:hypothetical protein
MGPLCGDQRLDSLRPTINTLQEDLFEPLDFGCPTIVVDTYNGCSPQKDAIVDRIDRLYGRPTIHDIDK